MAALRCLSFAFVTIEFDTALTLEPPYLLLLSFCANLIAMERGDELRSSSRVLIIATSSRYSAILHQWNRCVGLTISTIVEDLLISVA